MSDVSQRVSPWCFQAVLLPVLSREHVDGATSLFHSFFYFTFVPSLPGRLIHLLLVPFNGPPTWWRREREAFREPIQTQLVPCFFSHYTVQ